MNYHDFIVFDVIGTRFRVQKRIFDNYPTTLFYSLARLGKLEMEQLPRDIVKVTDEEFFLLRSPDAFKVVLLYCINGKLHVPRCICSDEVVEEFNFWRLKYDHVCTHCADHHNQEQSSDDETDQPRENDRQCTNVMNCLWTFLQDPHSSRCAFVFNAFSMFVIFVSILNIIVSSVPTMQYCSNGTYSDDVKAAEVEDDFERTNCVGTFVFNVIDIVCMSWFTLELILRFISCPIYKTFFKSPLIIIDILSILPFYLELIVWLIDENNEELGRAKTILTFLRMFKLLRMFRVLKLARYSFSLKVLGKTIYSARADLSCLVMFVVIALLVFSNCLYQVEKDQPETEFTSIPATIWWCIVTLSTVGYGDMYPQTVLGKFIAGIACVCGVLLFAFPIAVLVEKFTTTYNEQRKKDKEKHRRKHLFNFHLLSHNHPLKKTERV